MDIPVAVARAAEATAAVIQEAVPGAEGDRAEVEDPVEAAAPTAAEAGAAPEVEGAAVVGAVTINDTKTPESQAVVRRQLRPRVRNERDTKP